MANTTKQSMEHTRCATLSRVRWKAKTPNPSPLNAPF